ncbi:MAG: U32 family peptidase [Paludibacteraceae bacterium]|nr:U32 family peptidase [Paludibacteraceae bacterium]
MSGKTKIELLSPAKNLTVGKAAIDAGADAVYIGAPRFGARAAAGNSVADIAALCRYAHVFGAKVLVTVNTLMSDSERKAAAQMAWQLYEAGADALIVQDLRLLEENLPPVRLHASTQCDNRAAVDVLAREREGFKRVVLARELTIEEIKAIRAQSGVELEAFVHGALCVSYSGRCYMSEYVCGRSANRGNCAQMCRLKYDLLDRDMNELVHQKHVLSLRDLDRSRQLRELLGAGVTTLKIEGRLKDEAYVRNITAYYRLLLDRLFAEPDSPWQRASMGNIYLDFSPDPEKTFHRSGTDYFLHGRTPDMANWETPKSTGEYVGRVTNIGRNYIETDTNKELHNGDGLCFGDRGFLVNRTERQRIYPNRMPDITIGTALYRNYDILFQQALENSKTCRKLPVSIMLEETEDGFCVSIGSHSRRFVCDKTPAQNAERAEQTVCSQLGKLGDTPYEAAGVSIRWSRPYFLRTSVLNQWRRETLEQMQEDTWANEPAGASETDERINTIPEGAPLMTCRYCILHEMGMCRKQRTGQTAKEPAYLRQSGRLFALHFDCQRCEMQVLPA